MTFQSDEDVHVTAESAGFKTIRNTYYYIYTRFFTA